MRNNDEVIQDILLLKDSQTNYADIPQERLFSSGNIQLSQSSIDFVLDKIAAESIPLLNESTINQGVLSGADTLTDKHIKLFGNLGKKGDGIFVLNLENERDRDIFESIPEEERDLLKPFYKNSDIEKYYVEKEPTKYILYIDKKTDISNYPTVLNHLKKYEKILSEKRETKQGKLPWYCLHWSRTEDIFKEDKIIVPYRSDTNTFALVNIPWYFRTDAYSIIPERFNINVLLAILSSRLIYLWLKVKGKNKGKTLELFYDPLSKIPVPKLDSKEKNQIAVELEKLVSEIITKKKVGDNSNIVDIEHQIDELVMTLYNLTEEEKGVVRNL